jgi:hypothetical protein
MSSGPFSLRDVDWRSAPAGLPEVPPKWAPFLLQKPVSGAITEVLADQVAVLSAGVKAGLKAGLEFVREKNQLSSRMKVLFTEPERCFVRISTPEIGVLPVPVPRPFNLMMLRPEPLVVGEKISSRTSDSANDP